MSLSSVAVLAFIFTPERIPFLSVFHVGTREVLNITSSSKRDGLLQTVLVSLNINQSYPVYWNPC